MNVQMRCEGHGCNHSSVALLRVFQWCENMIPSQRRASGMAGTSLFYFLAAPTCLSALMGTHLTERKVLS